MNDGEEAYAFLSQDEAKHQEDQENPGCRLGEKRRLHRQERMGHR
jgi:hypothetical protein